MFKCLNPECGREFPILGRLDEELIQMRNTPFAPGKRILSSPACPFCGSKEWEEKPKSNTEEKKK
jgi:hypothetical protein